jgi:hypothetical protein
VTVRKHDPAITSAPSQLTAARQSSVWPPSQDWSTWRRLSHQVHDHGLHIIAAIIIGVSLLVLLMMLADHRLRTPVRSRHGEEPDEPSYARK